MDQIIGLLILLMLWLVGNKYKYAWFVGILVQLMLLFLVIIGQSNTNLLSIGVVFVMYVRNAYKWSKKSP